MVEGLVELVQIGDPNGPQAVRAAAEGAAYLGALRYGSNRLVRSLRFLCSL